MLSADVESWSHAEMRVNGVHLHYVEAGSGPLVVLLHGFPEFWYSWRHQIPVLAAAGFHVVAPDLRGYNLSEKPSGIKAYRLECLTADVAALIRHFGAPATLVGHDWGGVIAWRVPVDHAGVVDRLVVLNGPHPAAYARALRTWDQLRRAWYVFVFQLPLLPEALLRRADYRALGNVLRRTPVRPGAFSETDIQLYKQAMAQPGALTAALNYYRANFLRLRSHDITRSVVPVPTLLIWGDRDHALSLGLTRDLDRWVPNLRVEHLPDCGHWVQNEAPERVNQLLLDFLRSG
jgi:pimeloyl-ACP methyl ester carboxylesterase